MDKYARIRYHDLISRPLKVTDLQQSASQPQRVFVKHLRNQGNYTRRYSSVLKTMCWDGTRFDVVKKMIRQQTQIVTRLSRKLERAICVVDVTDNSISVSFVII